MSRRPPAPAELPPAGITGLEPRWSRLVHVPGIDEAGRTWHLLDSWAAHADGASGTAAGDPQQKGTEPELTLLCVHGNPSWSFIWRKLIAQLEQVAGSRVRTIAVDQLDMGFSERSGRKRTLATRIDDLCQLTATLKLTGPVLTVAHDWGGPVSLGWALRHLPGNQETGQQASERDVGERPATEISFPQNPSRIPRATLAGVVLTNTAVHQPAGSPAPALIRLVRSAPLLRPATVYTRAFIQGAIEMSRPRLPAAVRAGFVAPYRSAARRSAIADFVADIPLDPEHESAATLDAIAAGLTQLARTPTLLLWGPRDQVFSDLYLHDLEHRLPHAAVHRFPNASHFVAEDADVAGAVCDWVQQFLIDGAAVGPSAERTEEQLESRDGGGQGNRVPPAASRRRALTDFEAADPKAAAVVEPAPTHRSISFADFAQQVDRLAAGMAALGIKAGARVAVLIPPGVDLALTVYGCWRLGAVVVLVDSGLGPKGMHRALRSANPAYLIGIDRALTAARALRWPGQRIAVTPASPLRRKLLEITADLSSLRDLGLSHRVPPPVSPKAVAAVVFTSGSTGPSKGVVYRHEQIQAQRDALRTLYDIAPGDRLVAAFAPFALYGPTLGVTSMVPAMDVAAPGTLTATALADALQAVDATLLFASPAALVNVVATAEPVRARLRSSAAMVRLVLSAGAPVRTDLLRRVAALFPAAALRTPYGMTEVLPVTDVALDQLDRQLGGSSSAGVCVGQAVPGVDLAIDALDALGQPSGTPSTEAGVLGEILVRAAHAREGYDRLWWTGHRASQPAGWHRSGDVGQLDAQGCLYVSGRLGHVISTAAGAVGPVACEQLLEELAEVDLAAVVGVGPVGTQVAVAVVQLVGTAAEQSRGREAPLALIDRARDRARAALGLDLATVLLARKLPVDRRHNSKIDRAAVAAWAARVLSGARTAAL